jgi:hypothetical protein
MIQEEEVDEEDTRINYIRPIPPERLKALKSQIEEDVDSDALAEQQLVTEYQQTLNSPRPKSKKQTRKGTKQVRHGNLFRPYRGKKAPQSTCEEDLIALATGAVLKSKLIVSAEGKPTLWNITKPPQRTLNDPINTSPLARRRNVGFGVNHQGRILGQQSV